MLGLQAFQQPEEEAAIPIGHAFTGGVVLVIYLPEYQIYLPEYQVFSAIYIGKTGFSAISLSGRRRPVFWVSQSDFCILQHHQAGAVV
jgi:hypothetical protein